MLSMPIDMQFKPIAEAIIKNMELKDPDEVVFVVGRKKYRAKALLKHFRKEDSVAENIIKMALNVNTSNKVITLNPDSIDDETINKTVKMFEV